MSLPATNPIGWRGHPACDGIAPECVVLPAQNFTRLQSYMPSANSARQQAHRSGQAAEASSTKIGKTKIKAGYGEKFINPRNENMRN